MTKNIFFAISLFILGSTTLYLYFSKPTMTHEDLYGNWERCIEGQIKKIYTFTKSGNFSRKKEYYLEDHDCKGSLSYEHNLEGSFKSYNGKNYSNKLAQSLEITINKATITTHDKETTALYNEKTVCEQGTWAQGKTIEITGIVASDCEQYKKGTKIFRYLEFRKNYLKIGRKTLKKETLIEKLKAGQYRKIL